MKVVGELCQKLYPSKANVYYHLLPTHIISHLMKDVTQNGWI